jgi:hypothetical protein
VFVYLVVVVEMAPDQNSQFDLDSSMMAEFEADFLVLVFQVASELVEKLGLHFVKDSFQINFPSYNSLRTRTCQHNNHHKFQDNNIARFQQDSNIVNSQQDNKLTLNHSRVEADLAVDIDNFVVH